MPFYQKHLFFCTNQRQPGKRCCENHHAADMCVYTKARLRELDIYGPGKVRVSSAGCLGRCELGPSLVIYPDNVWYRYHSQADINEIIAEHVQAGNIVERLRMPTDEKHEEQAS